MLEHVKRWLLMGCSIETWHENIQEMVEFAENRPEFMIKYINEIFNLDGTVKINLITDSKKGYIKNKFT